MLRQAHAFERSLYLFLHLRDHCLHALDPLLPISRAHPRCFLLLCILLRDTIVELCDGVCQTILNDRVFGEISL